MAGPQSNYKSELASLLMLDRGRDVNKYASATMEIQWGLGLAMVDLLSEDPYVGINQRVKLNPSDAKLYVEQHADKVLKISEFKPAYIDPISKEDLLDEFDFFEGHEEGIYLFFDQVDDTNMLVVKPNLDYKAIKDGNIESLASITNDDDDWEELVDYCKKHSKSSGQYHFYTSKPLSKFKKTLYDYYDGYMFGIGTDFIKKWASSQKDKELVRGDFERIDFIGEELSYMPKYFNPYHEYYVTLELKDKKSPIHITFYIPEEDTQKAVPYSIKYGDKTYYLNAKAHTKLKQEILKIEQEQNNKKKEQEKSFWQKAIDLINF